MQILGVRRAHRFSPNSVVRDAEIFNAVVSLLESYDHSVVAVDEDTLIGSSQWREVRRL